MNNENEAALVTAMNRLGSALRVQQERWFELPQMIKVDINDAVTNFELSFNGVLEELHSVCEKLRYMKVSSPESNSSIRFLNLIRNVRHHSSARLPFAMTETFLAGTPSGKWFRHEVVSHGEVIAVPMALPLVLTELSSVLDELLEIKRIRTKGYNSIINGLKLKDLMEEPIKSQEPVLDLNPLIIDALSLIANEISIRGLNEGMREDAQIYVEHFTGLFPCKITALNSIKPNVFQ